MYINFFIKIYSFVFSKNLGDDQIYLAPQRNFKDVEGNISKGKLTIAYCRRSQDTYSITTLQRPQVLELFLKFFDTKLFQFI